MQARLPAVADELMIITEAYIQVRYGEVDEAKLSVERVETAWQRVKEAGEQSR